MTFGEGDGHISKTMRKEHKEVQTEISIGERSTQTDITLVSNWYDKLFDNIETIDEVVKELDMRKRVMEALKDQNIDEKDIEDGDNVMEKLNKIVADVSCIMHPEDDTYVPQLKLELQNQIKTLKITQNRPSELQIPIPKSQLRKSTTIGLSKISVLPDTQQPADLLTNNGAGIADHKILFNPSHSPMMSRNGSMVMEEMINMTDAGELDCDKIELRSPLMLSVLRRSLTKQDSVMNIEGSLSTVSPFLATERKINLSVPKLITKNSGVIKDTNHLEPHDSFRHISFPAKKCSEFIISINQTEPTLTVDSAQNPRMLSMKGSLEPIEEEVERNDSSPKLSDKDKENAIDSFNIVQKDESPKRREEYRRYKSSDMNGLEQQGSESVFSIQPLPLVATSSFNNPPADTMSMEKASYNQDVPFEHRTINFMRADSISASGSKVGLLQKLTFEINKSMLLTKRLQQEKVQTAALEKSRVADKEHIQEVLSKVEEKDQQIRRLEAELKKFRDTKPRSEHSEDSQSYSKDNIPAFEEEIKRRQQRRERAQRNKEDKRIISEQLQNYSNLEGRYNQNNARNLISKLNLGKFANFKNPMSLKTVLRTIFTLYIDRMEEISLKPETRHLPLCEYVYNYYLQVFGIKTISEKKFTYFILSLKCHAQYFRVNLFSRFMGLIEHQKYDEDLVVLYFEGMTFLESSTKGYPIKNKDTSVRCFYPYTRAIDFLQHLFADKLSRPELLEFRKSVDKHREADPNSLNSAIVDIDLFMEKVIHKYAILVNGNKQYVIDAFKACDLDGNNACSVNEFLLLNRYLEPKNFELSACIKRFFDNADTITDKEQNMSFNKFAVVCTNFNLFSDKSQKDFLAVKDKNDLEMLFYRLQKGWDLKYSNLCRNLESFESLMPEETKSWRTILDLLNERMGMDTAVEIKPTLIALRMTELEFDRINDEDELDDDNADNDITRIVSKRTIPGTGRDSFGRDSIGTARMLPVILQE